MSRKRRLGKGLGALINEAGAEPLALSTEKIGGLKEAQLRLPVEKIVHNRFQPRRSFNPETIAEMAASIEKQGLIQPVVVNDRGDGTYELISGERRLRAVKQLGWKDIPAIIKKVDQEQILEMTLVENLQREDLNPIEEAEAFHRLIDEHGYSQAEVATRVGRDRSTISNSLRLLNLPADVKGMVLDGEITEGHARAVLQTGSDKAMISLARQAAQRGLSVRETERRARSLADGKAKATKAAKAALSPQVRNLTERLQRALGAKVKIVDSKGKGRLEISYSSYEELDGILDKILK